MANLKRIKSVVKHMEKEMAKNDKLIFNMHTWLTLVGEDGLDESGNSDPRYKCGTNMCFGGWAVHKAGGTIIQLAKGWGEPRVLEAHSLQMDDLGNIDISGYDLPSIEEWATDYFDLTLDEADRIFHATWVRNIEHLKGVIDEVLEESVFEVAVDVA